MVKIITYDLYSFFFIQLTPLPVPSVFPGGAVSISPSDVVVGSIEAFIIVGMGLGLLPGPLRPCPVFIQLAD